MAWWPSPNTVIVSLHLLTMARDRVPTYKMISKWSQNDPSSGGETSETSHWEGYNHSLTCAGMETHRTLYISIYTNYYWDDGIEPILWLLESRYHRNVWSQRAVGIMNNGLKETSEDGSMHCFNRNLMDLRPNISFLAKYLARWGNH